MTAPDLCPRDRQLFSSGKKRILALDGGGIRGIVALAYLERIENLLRQREGRDIRLCEYFHLIGGTSTGSIIATGLALGMEVADLIRIYVQLSKKGFQGSRWHGGVFVPKFRTKPLMSMIRANVGDETLGSENVKTGLAIVAKRVDTGSVWIFHNNPRGVFFAGDGGGAYTPNKDLPLAQLVRASTAAPTFFAPERIVVAPGVEGLFVDGGVSPHNNPALMLFMLATISGYGYRWPTGADNLSIISVGTGLQPISAASLPPSWAPSVALAVLGLRSIIEDNIWLNQALLQWMGTSPTPWRIDGEVGDLSGDRLGPAPLLTYARYDLMLEHAWLEQELGVRISNEDLASYCAIDVPEIANDLLELGRTAAKKQVQSEHL